MRGVGPSRRSLLAGGGLLAAFAASAGVGAVALAAGSRARTRLRPLAPVAAAGQDPASAAAPGCADGGCRVCIRRTRGRCRASSCSPRRASGSPRRRRRGTSGLVGSGRAGRWATSSSLGWHRTDASSIPWCCRTAGTGWGSSCGSRRGARVVYSCWFAPDASGRLYDVVRIPYGPGVAARACRDHRRRGPRLPARPVLRRLDGRRDRAASRRGRAGVHAPHVVGLPGRRPVPADRVDRHPRQAADAPGLLQPAATGSSSTRAHRATRWAGIRR